MQRRAEAYCHAPKRKDSRRIAETPERLLDERYEAPLRQVEAAALRFIVDALLFVALLSRVVSDQPMKKKKICC